MIEAEGLSRSFDDHVAVDGLTFTVPRGALLALLGPNGAGKTTTVRLLMGLIAPTGGRAVVAGHAVERGAGDRRALRRACGLLTETPGFYERHSAWENLAFFARLYGLGEGALRARVEHHLRAMGLWERRGDPVGTFSKGMKQKLAIIRAVFHEPQVVFLDEPTAGLDPEAAIGVRELIASLKGEGRTLVVCTHNLDEASRLADLVGILRSRMLRFDTIGRLQRDAAGERVRVTVVGAAPPVDAVRALEGVSRVERLDGAVDCWVDDARRVVPDVVRRLVADGAAIVDVRPVASTLESVYLDALRGETAA